MDNSKRNEAAVDLWAQIFSRRAQEDGAAIADPKQKLEVDEDGMRIGLSKAGWSPSEIEARIEQFRAQWAVAPATHPGIHPQLERTLSALCDDIEAAMERLGMDSHACVARGIEPRIGAYAAMNNVMMTDQGIVIVGSFLFRFCGLIARAFTRTLRLAPGLWELPQYSEAIAKTLLQSEPRLAAYWLSIFVSFGATGTHAMVPYRPANKEELLHFEQVARAMEIFAIAHEYGHHHHAHGRQLESDSKQEEFDADQFALRICYEVERNPLIYHNPYLPSGAGGVVLLMGLEILKGFKEAITGKQFQSSGTHPSISDRLGRFDSVAALKPQEFGVLKGFRIASTRIMTAVGAEVSVLLLSLDSDLRHRLQTFSNT